MCFKCKTLQLLSKECSNCGKFPGNLCLKCLAYTENDSINYFHCDKCGNCRKGKREDFYHCKNCDRCILISENNHKCFAGNTHCPVCLEALKGSFKKLVKLKCNHRIHLECLGNLEICPMCRVPFVIHVDPHEQNSTLKYLVCGTTAICMLIGTAVLAIHFKR